MKFLIAMLVSGSLPGLAAADITLLHQWKHRLLFVPEMSPALDEELCAHTAGLEERDVIVHVLAGPASTGKLMPAVEAEQLKSGFRLSAGHARIVLLGKDGRTTARWSLAEFSPEALFARIDAMPMRQREMRGER